MAAMADLRQPCSISVQRYGISFSSSSSLWFCSFWPAVAARGGMVESWRREDLELPVVSVLISGGSCLPIFWPKGGHLRAHSRRALMLSAVTRLEWVMDGRSLLRRRLLWPKGGLLWLCLVRATFFFL